MTEYIKQGALRGEKVKYSDGVGCCIWYPLGDNPENDDGGVCFDFPEEDIDDFIALLQKLKAIEARVYKDEDDE